IAGAGPAAQTLRSMVSSAGIDEKVDLLGSVGHEKIPSLIQAATLLELPSYNEGVPNVLLEAMSCGVPVVATRAGGIPEVVDEGVSGLLVEPGNIDQLSDAILTALSVTWDRSCIKSQAERFTWEENIGVTTGLLNEALNTVKNS
ncbi:MAG: glycosyltransferase, partial [Pseudomonadales bacterium]|nr:glycosyltransferase [Pseudomonadales bacterium]